MNYKSYQDMSLTIWRSLWRFPASYDLVVGVPRSGMIPAAMISSYLNVPLASLDSFLKGEVMTSGQTRAVHRTTDIASLRQVLVVDDSVLTGSAMKEARARVAASAIVGSLGASITYAAVYSATRNPAGVDFYLEVLPAPRCFQWNIFHHEYRAMHSCYDIDGVLNRDPRPEENDDGDEYRKFLRDVQVKLPLRFTAGALVSARLEKYRGETESWLARHGFRYKRLFLLDMPSKAERLRHNAHASFKASVYKAGSEDLFVESEWAQAVEIARISGKDVFCTENMRYIKGGSVK